MTWTLWLVRNGKKETTEGSTQFSRHVYGEKFGGHGVASKISPSPSVECIAFNTNDM
jgi:hypothetical protein